MKDMIIQKLHEIEEKEKIKILFACESGSRAWGYESEDSDYDVRFIYVRHKEDYLSLFPKRDVIEWELSDIYDINGWDLSKALRLLYSSNPTLYEWKHSPIIYYETPEWKSIDLVFDYYFQTHRSLYHYYHMTKTTYQRPKTLKRYLYALRSILSCLYIIEYKTSPPIELRVLVDIMLSDDMKDYVYSLLEMKKTQKEKDSFPESFLLNNYIEEQLIFIEPYLKSHKIHLDHQLLDKTFLSILNAIYP